MKTTMCYNDMQLASYFDAVSFSYLMHKGQNRRDLGIPYWVHVALVSSTVAEWGGDPIQVEAALTHDVIEDTGIDLAGFVAVMGEEVGCIVDSLTGDKDKRISWQKRKLSYLFNFHEEIVDPRSYLCKLADMHSNMTSFTNTKIRTGVGTASENTINSYVALTHICLAKLKKHGTDAQFRVAKFNMQRMFDRVKVCELSEAALLNRLSFDDLEGVDFFEELATLWNLNEWVDSELR